MRLLLPYPPSINRYWRRAGRHIHISREGRQYRERVGELLCKEGVTPLPGRLAVRIDLAPPDHRKRDVDNIQKPLLDALEHGGAFEDDSQIDWLLTARGEKAQGGLAAVTIRDWPLVGACPVCGSAL
jgi:crossover junction endodeoxyribonuclease RusA